MPSSNSGRKRVALIDGEATVVGQVVASLQPLGYEVVGSTRMQLEDWTLERAPVGADMVIAKPVRAAELEEAVVALIGGARADRPLAKHA